MIHSRQILPFVGIGNLFFIVMAFLVFGEAHFVTVVVYLLGAILLTPITMFQLARKLGKPPFSQRFVLSLGFFIFVLGASLNQPLLVEKHSVTDRSVFEAVKE